MSLLYQNMERERDHNHIMWSFYFVGCKKWYNANFSWKHSKGVYSVHVNLDHESMKEFFQGSQQFDNAQCKDKQHKYRVFKIIHYMALVGLWQIKEELCEFFFQIKFPKYLNIKSEDHVIKPYHTHQLLR